MFLFLKRYHIEAIRIIFSSCVIASDFPFNSSIWFVYFCASVRLSTFCTWIRFFAWFPFYLQLNSICTFFAYQHWLFLPESNMIDDNNTQTMCIYMSFLCAFAFSSTHFFFFFTGWWRQQMLLNFFQLLFILGHSFISIVYALWIFSIAEN